jgi:hypothetical protein
MFFIWKYIKIIFFIFKKKILTSTHQNNLKILKKLFLKKLFFSKILWDKWEELRWLSKIQNKQMKIYFENFYGASN